MSSSQEDVREARRLLRNERDRERRRSETEEDKRARRSKRNARDRFRRAQTQQMESPSDREDRLSKERARIRGIREHEDPAVREERLAGDRARHALRREQEDPAVREERLAGDRARHALRREQEDPAVREERLAGDRARVTLRREQEDPAEREERLAGNRARAGQRRRLEEEEFLPISTQMLNLHEALSSITSSKCETCLECFPNLSVSSQPNGIIECRRCAHDKRIPKLFSKGNNMDPGVVPAQLQGLSQAEEMLISAVLPVMSIYKLPHGQYGYSGHVINFPQDVQSFATSLPRLAADISVLVVRKEREQTHRDFHVRRRVVEDALTWLMDNNIYYQRHSVRLNQETLTSLPEDGDLSDLRSIQPVQSEAEVTSDEATTGDHYSSSFVPNAAPPATERETIQQALGQSQSSTLMWPSVGGTPINEFTTEGYFSMAFPTLFPTGTADYNGIRSHRVRTADYFTHLMKYDDGRFAKHPRFRFFALNTEMRWRANETGRFYIKQHPGEAHLTVDDLRDMIGREGERFSNKVVHYGTSLRGTRQYWFKERNKLIAMIDTLGLPTIFFTHSAADHQWPELAHLICPEDPDDKQARARAVINNPALADWFFTYRIQRFVEVFYVSILGATDYWMRFEWQHRGSPHVHGLAWLPNAPNVEDLLSSSPDLVESTKEKIIEYADKIISTINPAVLPDGSNVSDAPPAKVDPHICNKSYSEVTDFEEDLTDLIATCQRHTRCSESYCLRTRNGKQECRFGYPKDLQAQTTINITEEEPVILTARNDGMLNSFNPIQLTSWRANVDMQYIVSRNRVVQYCTKYVTKSETRSQSLRDTFANIAHSLKEGNKSVKAVQKLLINSFGERDYSAQETCHLLLQLPMYKASRSFFTLSLDGSRSVENTAQEGERATAHSVLDHYMSRPSTTQFNTITILDFTRQYTMPKELGEEPKKRSKEVIVTPRPYCSPDPSGPNYEQYCRQSLMKCKPFRDINELKSSYDTFTEAYAEFLQSGNVPRSLEQDIFRLQQHRSSSDAVEDEEDTSQEEQQQNQQSRAQEEWMLICQRTSELEPVNTTEEEHDWAEAARSYPDIDNAPHFIAQGRQNTTPTPFTTSATPDNLKGRQLDVYTTVKQHFESNCQEPLHIIINGTAGTGKSYLINCLRLLLGGSVKVAAPTGVASFIIEGRTLHSLLHLPVRGDFKEMEGSNLQKMQDELSSTKYLIIDEMSMVGRKTFGMIDRRLRQAFPGKSQVVFGGCSILLFGDFGQLPPVMDLPIYTTVTQSDLSDQGYRAYNQFETAFTLTQVMRQSGQDPDQIRFRDILMRLRNGDTTMEDWNHLMEQTPTRIQDQSPYVNALRLFPTVEAVVDHNVAMLRECGHPIATIKAVHTGANAAKAPPDDAGGLEPVVMLARSARVMLTSNLWVEVGLVNGAMGTVEAICYKETTPPHLPVAVMVRFDHYTGPTVHDGTVPITPVRRNWSSSGNQCSRLQLPLKLAWAVTIHKSQGLTLDKVVIDVGKKEFSCGLTFVACSRVRKLKDILFMPPFPLQRLKSIANSKRLQERKEEDQRLLSLQESTAESSIEDIPLPVSISEDQETTLMEWMTPSLLTSAPFLQPVGSQEDMEWMTPSPPTPSPPSSPHQ